MNLNEFSVLCETMLNKYFRFIEKKHEEGRIIDGNGVRVKICYPTMLLCVESEEKIFSVEFLGVTKKFSPLKVKKRSYGNLKDLTLLSHGDFPSQAIISMSDDNSFRGFLFSNEKTLDFYDVQRHPIIDEFKTQFCFKGEATHAFDFTDDFGSGLISNVVLASRSGVFFRAKYISFQLFFSNKSTESFIVQRVNDLIANNDGFIFGVQNFTNSLNESWVRASHLINLVLNDKILETTIGDYINANPEIILDSLGYKGMVYEPLLRWVEKTPDNEDEAINPDALLKRADGFYDICDFKRGLLNRKKVTKADRNRRRFIDDVNEGIAQLDNYAEYFSFPGNNQHALERYNVRVFNPKKILIVGNLENTDRIQVQQALRCRPDIIVVDYDTLISNYYASIKPNKLLLRQKILNILYGKVHLHA
ncbi:Shedu anti-phage system protein SduA domain-containing protein [Erwinia sp. Leaf53]|uniref:Shedu anti-phage system protein SduA domain-containing protein n=1 Tax=Erwinia sp. Leaf53 TaxID=1736225 RepID=UPI000700BD8B|nr:Shedu anti-phage system protein SduA domain-containing protein [Erwinia sp. Leaf53]KQN57984.1 hypothetical protein ASF13_04105 [Erwinia sp. Leaf53]